MSSSFISIHMPRESKSAYVDVCQLMTIKPCICQLQYEVRRSAEKYHAACVACDLSKRTLVSIEQQSSSTAGDSVSASFSADKQEALNRATDEVSILTLLLPCTTAFLQFMWRIAVQYSNILLKLDTL